MINTAEQAKKNSLKPSKHDQGNMENRKEKCLHCSGTFFVFRLPDLEN